MRELAGNDVPRRLVLFARTLRAAGVEVEPARIADALRALAAVGLTSRDDVYWALRQTLVSTHDDLAAFDALFARWVGGSPEPHEAEGEQADLGAPDGTARRESSAGEGEEAEKTTAGASYEEALRQRSFADLTPEEATAVARLIALVPARRPLRRSRRLRPHHARGLVDLRATARRALATGGEPFALAYRRQPVHPRNLVVLCDVSGSMAPFARSLLLYAHALLRSGPRVEAFAFGTRLTRLTPELRRKDVGATLAKLAAESRDWSGGTRIGEALMRFNAEWGRRGIGRSAVVAILSDGWERGDISVLEREMARLSRRAYAVIWVNPHGGLPGFEPLAGGMQAALPYVDRFLPGANVEDIERLADVLGGIGRRHALDRSGAPHEALSHLQTPPGVT